MFKREQRTFWDNAKLGGIFVFLGGYTGILTSVLLGHFVNCMSGNVTETGVSLGHLELFDAFKFCVVVLSFITGAFCATKLVDKHRYGHVSVLIAEASLLMLIRNMLLTPALWLASLAMGLQNGLTTYLSWDAGKVRTTHVTGSTTDIGVSLANGKLSETGFAVFQLIMYMVGAAVAFYAVKQFGSLAFTMEGAAIILIAASTLWSEWREFNLANQA